MSITSSSPNSQMPNNGAKPARNLKTPEYKEFDRIKRRLGIAILALALVTTAGVLGFAIIGAGEYSFIDAIYMTIITLTTVGFTEIIDMSNNPAGRVFTVLLLVGGMGIVAYSVSMLGAFLIEGHLEHIFARGRMDKAIPEMKNHLIVCGDTSATWHAVEELTSTGRSVVLRNPHGEGARRSL